MAHTLTFIGKKIGIFANPTAPQGKAVWRFACKLSGVYANGGGVGVPGETLDFNAALNPGKHARPHIPGGGPAGNLPKNADITATGPGAFTYKVERNAVSPTPKNFALRVFSGDPATEIANGAYDVSITGDSTGVIIEVSAPLRDN